MIVFIYKWRKKWRFSHRDGIGAVQAVIDQREEKRLLAVRRGPAKDQVRVRLAKPGRARVIVCQEGRDIALDANLLRRKTPPRFQHFSNTVSFARPEPVLANDQLFESNAAGTAHKEGGRFANELYIYIM